MYSVTYFHPVPRIIIHAVLQPAFCRATTDSRPRMTRVSDTLSWEEMCQLTGPDMDFLLQYYPENQVPTFRELRIAQGAPDPQSDLFDGSFGFSVGA